MRFTQSSEYTRLIMFFAPAALSEAGVHFLATNIAGWALVLPREKRKEVPGSSVGD